MQMKLIFCLEKNKGTMFLGKRQSKDRVLNQRLLQIVGNSKLWVSEYSSEMFELSDSLVIDNDYKNKAEVNDYCFVEDKGYELSCVDEIILCFWNRKYPSDQFFDIDLKGNSFKKVSTENIVGSSHDKITIEIYKKG